MILKKPRNNFQAWDANFWAAAMHNEHGSEEKTLQEWLTLVTHDYDEIDRLYIESGTMGGE